MKKGTQMTLVECPPDRTGRDDTSTSSVRILDSASRNKSVEICPGMFAIQ